MSEQSSGAIPPVRGKAAPRTIKVTRVGVDGAKTRDFRMRPLRDDELQSAKAAIVFARARIAQKGGDSGPSSIDRHGARDRSEWAKRLLKFLTGVEGSVPWSCNDAIQLSEALQKCEKERVIKALREANGGISEGELRRRYNGWRNDAIAEAEKPTGEVVGGELVVQGGAIPVEYDDWIESQADHKTMTRLQGMQSLLLFGQTISAAEFVEVPTFAALYEPDVAPAIAAQIARYLMRENILPKTRYQHAFEALLRVFVAQRDSCRHAFWSHFRRYDVQAVEGIEREMRALREEMG